VIVAAFVIAAAVTPPDVFSQLILAVPLIVLFEAGLIAARLIAGARSGDTLAYFDVD
jgi:sec-independent protein translocase protein TatC